MTEDRQKSVARILVVDDEESIRDGIREYLQLEGYEADGAASAEEAIERGIGRYDLVLLDVMMDGMSGFDLLGRMRDSEMTAAVPVIFLTAKDAEDDMIRGLRSGADDYIAKPFSMKNVLARIEAVLRRRQTASVREHGTASARGVFCDRQTMTCRVDGRELKLPRKEFEILALFLEHPGRIFTRDELMKAIWPDNVVVVDRSVDVHIARLRSKIAPYNHNIVSRSGYGYGWQD